MLLVGTDSVGNKYYQTKKYGSIKRLVRYKGMHEPTKVPSSWYAWLHGISDKVPNDNNKLFPWEKDRTMNLTGTNKSYYPSGHLLSINWSPNKNKDYHAWKP